MDAAFMRKTFALIAKGLIEKEQFLQKEPSRYPYSKALQHGINMFLAASQRAGCQTATQYADETSFLAHFITRPIGEWFNEWNPDMVDKLKLQEEPFYAYDSFAYRRAGNVYIPSSDCYEFLETQDNDIMDGTDERILYEKMAVLEQETYCRIRRYIIENPIITLEDRRAMSLELADNPAARDAFQFAYEEITEDSYRCPQCGWTMVPGKYGYICHSTHCTDILPELTDEMKLETSAGDLYRLKKGVMRYFAVPGKLELEIVAFCEKKKLRWALWPQMDRYDVEVQFSDGEVWEIDAKAYRNPIALRTKIQNDNGFPKGDYARGYFVVPSEYTVNQRNYTAIINRVLEKQKNVKCVTLKTLKTEITRKEASCHEKNNKDMWYAALSAQFQIIEDAMPLRRFAAIEAVLHLLSLNAPNTDPAKAYLLFTQYQLIGTTMCTDMEHTLQRARHTLGYYRSQKYWQDDLREYQDPKYDAVRAFSFGELDGIASFSKTEGTYPHPYEERQKEWAQFWSDDFEEPNTPSYAGVGTYKYLFSNPENGEVETVQVKFDSDCTVPICPTLMEKGSRAPLSISLDELLNTAREMAEICPGDPCHMILKTNILKQINGASVNACTELTIREVINIVGMVGAGKSTLIKVLAFWCHQNSHRITVVVDTVAEVLNLQKYLSALGVTASPLIGRSERLKYINQVTQPNETCLYTGFSQYLTPACLIDGMDEQHGAAIAFGKEPCYSLKKGSKNHLCPYFDQCLGTKMLRECYTASVVLTTVAGFAASRVGRQRETFLELVMRDFDLVIFDESDRVQKTLDHFFMPETSFNSYIRECAEDCSAYMRLSSKRREENLAEQRYDEMQRQSVTVLSCLVKSLHHELGTWKKIAHGDPFSALTLLEDLYHEESEYKIAHSVYKAIYDLIDMQDEDNLHQSTLWAVLESSCKSTDEAFFNQMYRIWLNELGADFPRPKKDKAKRIQDARVKLILRLIYFDHFIRGLSDAYEASHETSYGQNELFGFLQTRFRQQQYFLPSALCGNLFGLKKTDDEDIILFRQFAFGRSLMKDLPYLRTDQQGKPAGPHVILLSGSSWAEGSYEYHVNRPVNYILEADSQKRAFLEKTRFFESGFPDRISGASDDQRMAQLHSATQKSVELIIREYERKAGKILLVVNSYSQAQEVQQTLEAALRKANCPARVCRMISDAVSNENVQGTVRRGEVSRFAKMNEEILIAPAMAIERGHNIVDEYGHSALCAVFFMVRPMAVPDDIQQKGSKLNGFVESHCKRAPHESLFAYNARIRQFAAQQWAKMSKSKSFGLAELDAEERKDVVATLFVLILQIFGRLARVTDVTKPEPHVYFIDGAFRGREGKQNDFDCLSELGRYLDALMTQKESAEIAETLYAPFYKAYRKDIQYEQ